MSRIETQPKQTLSLEELKAIEGSEIVDTAAFKEWAGENWATEGAVVSADDKPLIFYHGGSSGVEGFNRDTPRNTGEQQHGIYFSDRVNDARFYADKLKAEQLEIGDTPEASVYAVSLKMSNPYIIGENDPVNSTSLNEIPEGHDGIVNQKSQEVVVFDPSQVLIVGEAQR